MPALLQGLWDLLLPPTCAGCGAAAESPSRLCGRCHARLPWIARDACVQCQEQSAAPGGRRCVPCTLRVRTLDACVAACWFEGAAADWVRAFKYPPNRGEALSATARARIAAIATAAAERAGADAPHWVVPVPLHPRRLRGRGFNPAATIARDVARARGARFAPVALARTRDTPSQTGLDRAARARNVRLAFRARGRVPEAVWLVDDVVTTGATLEAAARALRAAGARRILAVCAARTPRPGSAAG